MIAFCAKKTKKVLLPFFEPAFQIIYKEDNKEPKKCLFRFIFATKKEEKKKYFFGQFFAASFFIFLSSLSNPFFWSEKHFFVWQKVWISSNRQSLESRRPVLNNFLLSLIFEGKAGAHPLIKAHH
jgi:hypothetical protein